MKIIERREYVKGALVLVFVAVAACAFKFLTVSIFSTSTNSDIDTTIASTAQVSSTAPVEAADTDVSAEEESIPVPGPDAVFKEMVNDALYKYYPLSVGTKWIYESYTYRFNEEYYFVKETSKVTVTVVRIYEEGGKEYAELSREQKITGWFKVDEEDLNNIKTYGQVPLPKDKELIFNSTAILEISGLTVRYVFPDYPQYTDTFPLKDGVLLDMNSSKEDSWESQYVEEALIWKRERADNYKMKTSEYKNCYKSTAYDLRGTSGSKNEIVFCEGLGPVKFVEESLNYARYSYYDHLLDFTKAPNK